jgi:type IV secretory pathway VirB2 component (pilin)
MTRPTRTTRSIRDTPSSNYAPLLVKATTVFVLVMVTSLALPEVALAGGGAGGIAPVEAQLTAIVDFIRGPAGIAICTIGLIAAIGGMVFNSQRGRPIGSFAIAAVGIVLFFAAPDIVAFLSAEGALF